MTGLPDVLRADILVLRVAKAPKLVRLDVSAGQESKLLLSSWLTQARPRSIKSLRMVGFETPVMRTVEAMELPSHRAAMT